MKQLIFKYYQNIIFLSIALLILFLGLNFINELGLDVPQISNYNQIKEVFAQEEEPIICKEQAFNVPDRVRDIFGLTDIIRQSNKLMIPIGEATDESEATAKRIIEQLDIIIDAIPRQTAAAKAMVELADQCNTENCSTGCETCSYDCSYDDPYPCPWNPAETCWRTIPDTCYALKSLPCSGEACPREAIRNKLSEVNSEKERIKNAYDRIDDIFTFKIYPAFNAWWMSCSIDPLYPDPSCSSEIELIIDKLFRSRDRIAGCVLLREDLEARVRGERTGKILMTCQGALSSNYLEKCYGLAECEAERAQGREPPTDWNCPRAENYFCCK